jgi:hypothetical protein
VFLFLEEKKSWRVGERGKRKRRRGKGKERVKGRTE